MLAIIKTGGKQYPAKVGSTLIIEKLDLEVGEKVNFDQVVMFSNGTSFVNTPSNVTVSATVVDNFRDDKTISFKKRRRHTYKRKKGHRQYLTEVRIDEIKE